jgi:hypothetical protein
MLSDLHVAGMEFAWLVRSLEETAGGSIASLSGEVRSGWANPLRGETMSAFVIYILLCAASTARPDCDTRTAVDVVLGPEANNEIMCGLESEEMLAKTSIQPRDGEYVKIFCARRRPPQTIEGSRSDAVARE